MTNFIINRPANFASSVQDIVRQNFPGATWSADAMKVIEPNMRAGTVIYDTMVTGSKRERFVWGTSRMGGSRLIG